MILNHKEAIQFTVDHLAEISIKSGLRARRRTAQRARMEGLPAG